MSNGKTIGELMEEMRLKAGAKEYHGHEYMALERFADDTRHMIIFDVLPYWTEASASFSCAVSGHFCPINMI